MSEQELKKSVEAMQNLRNDLTSSKEKALAFLVEAGIVTTSGELTKPYVGGAAIDPGFCLDLISSIGIHAIEEAYANFQSVVAASGAQMPENVGGTDLRLRKLDCAVINFFHLAREKAGDQPFDTVRACSPRGNTFTPIPGFASRLTSRYVSATRRTFTASSVFTSAICQTLKQLLPTIGDTT